jgi:N-acetylglucosamine-6-sulfatase
MVRTKEVVMVSTKRVAGTGRQKQMWRLMDKHAATRRGGDGFRARGILLGALACLAALFVAGCAGPATPQEEEEAQAPATQPNMIFVLTDDLDYASAQKMPEIRSQLIEEGASFEKAFVSHPICCPSRATALTGLYDHNHEVKGNAPPDGGFRKFVSEGHEENSIAVRLQEEGGYQTAFFGKYLNGYPDGEPTHVPPGWDEWYGKLNEQKLYDYEINENGEEVSYGSEEEDFFTDVLSGQATDFVRRAAPEEEPFFMYVAPTAPHGPATPAERHQGAFAEEESPRPPAFNEEDVSDKPSPNNNAERISEEEAANIDDYYRQRLESMLAVDEMVASLVEELEAAGELDNTYIFFTSDNGWFGGEHRIRSGKNRAYEESARVPLFVRGPGVAADTKTERLTLNTDFAPTFADLAGASFPADGRSLKPLLGDEEASSSWRSSVLLEKLPQGDSSEEEKGKGKAKGKQDKTGSAGVPKAGPGGQPAFEAVRTETHKYVEYENGDRELYDLEADPYELESLYESADPSLIENLKAKLDALRSCSEEGCQEAEDAP